MLDFLKNKSELKELTDKLQAVSRTQAVIEFKPDGTILHANENFLAVMGYRLDEVVGRHHSMFVDPAERNGNEYQEFWRALNRGEHFVKEYRRIAKGDREIWIYGSYNPLLDENGRVYKVIKFATDITEQRMKAYFEAALSGAVQSTSANIMIADPDRKIIYMNEAVTNLLSEAESDLRKDLPSFSVRDIIGGSMDRFHKNPAHQMRLLDELTTTYNAEISVGGRVFGLIANPVFAEDKRRLGTVVEWQDLTKEKELEAQQEEAEKAAVFNRIIKEAVDNTSTNIMIADADRTIIYMNAAVIGMLRNAEADLRKALPDFSVDKVIGGSMDRFHKNPAHQMALLDNLTTTYRAQITVSTRTFLLIANPIFAENGTRLGTIVEWIDRTEELATGNDVTRLVESASAGDFTARINTEGKEGFFLELSSGLNKLVEISERGLNDVSRVLGALAEGNLTERISADYQGTFDELKNYCNQTTENLTSMIGDIRNVADTIYTASSEIASGNSDLSGRTEQQASSLEETASSMEELTSTVRTNSDNAKQANVLADQATQMASQGGTLINEVVDTMAAINESAQKIEDIIGVIDGIAFQTNILALNAAVEAARAGEQGRGFAVVASEVRTLAQRSANAAKDIKGLISDSVSKIESGNSLVGQSGEAMGDIVTSIKRVNDIMAEIAAASVEQSSGIEEVSNAVSQMDEMTQQNAALVEEAAAAAESLQSQANELNRYVSLFKLSDSDSVSLAPQAALSAPPSRTVSRSSKPSSTSSSKLPNPGISDDDEWETF
ncbi:methyl-accepting chemotaxis protein [Gilvimarinus sp. SDUM040013]|uniref:Methyl-accepting chemotaxis protein n=1 Tax=Gilvimarinus gilvus TaxID=3058038 RepID=A0ABU4RUM9_9GAMM|nr:methyl-accepting chemotaxis protein [Gilvimarinus sp. SDUM040013]MDO3388421.1 methyl-accepting chemotaxis protein [Gilvimarinus sp. SDUM040013]MDX6847971.1 methyl-accepting chemotaxis protein [Gilvimarinus sp. SDUM040013]